MVKVCPNCEEENPDGNFWCKKCKSRLIEDSTIDMDKLRKMEKIRVNQIVDKTIHTIKLSSDPGLKKGFFTSKSSTLSGVKYIYHSRIIFLVSPLLLFALVLYASLTESDLFALFSVYFFGIILLFLTVIALVWYMRGLADMINGREELGYSHAYYVVIATVAFMLSIILFLVSAFFSQFLIIDVSTGFSVLISAFYLSDTLFNLLSPLILASLLLVISWSLMGLASVLLILELQEKKKKFLLWILYAFYILVPLLTAFVSIRYNFTLDIFVTIASIVVATMFVLVYRKTYHRLLKGQITATALVPCPFCKQTIPTDSESCPYCKKVF